MKEILQAKPTCGAVAIDVWLCWHYHFPAPFFDLLYCCTVLVQNLHVQTCTCVSFGGQFEFKYCMHQFGRATRNNSTSLVGILTKAMTVMYVLSMLIEFSMLSSYSPQNSLWVMCVWLFGLQCTQVQDIFMGFFCSTIVATVDVWCAVPVATIKPPPPGKPHPNRTESASPASEWWRKLCKKLTLKDKTKGHSCIVIFTCSYLFSQLGLFGILFNMATLYQMCTFLEHV